MPSTVNSHRILTYRINCTGKSSEISIKLTISKVTSRSQPYKPKSQNAYRSFCCSSGLHSSHTWWLTKHAKHFVCMEGWTYTYNPTTKTKWTNQTMSFMPTPPSDVKLVTYANDSMIMYTKHRYVKRQS